MESTERIRFAVAGTGWRALFFVRAARLLPERFELTAVLCRTRERAEAFSREHGVNAVYTQEQLLATRPEFVVSCVSKGGMAQFASAMLEAGMSVLSETPLATDEESLRALYALYRRTGTKLSLAEQYFLFPSHAARRELIKRGVIGEPVSCRLSTAHDYHAFSLFRAFLGDEGGCASIRAERTTTPVAVTGSRAGYLTDGEMGEETRTFARLRYPDGRLALYDFSGVQYHTAVRSRHVRILGTKGEISDDEVLFLTPDHRPARAALDIRRDVMTGTVFAVDFMGERVYENPFRADVPMDEDEIAVASMLAGMGAHVRGGPAPYPVRHAFRDAYLTCLLERAVATGEEVRQAPMEWETDD